MATMRGITYIKQSQRSLAGLGPRIAHEKREQTGETWVERERKKPDLIEPSGRAFPSHGRGRRFNPCSAHHAKYLFIVKEFALVSLSQINAPMFPPKKPRPLSWSAVRPDRGNGAIRLCAEAEKSENAPARFGNTQATG
jgi:hypothetical protein